MEIDQYETIVIECEGVLWKNKQLITPGIELIKHSLSLGKKVFFLSNDSGSSTKAITQKLTDLGYTVPRMSVYSIADLTPVYLAENHSISKIFVIGSPSLKEILTQAGYETIHSSDFNQTGLILYDDMKEVQINPEINCVVVGFDFRFNYLAGMYASMCIQNGARFLATDKAATVLTNSGPVPSTGMIVAYLEVATDKQPEIIGMPNTFMFETLIREQNLDKSTSVFISSTSEHLESAKAIGLLTKKLVF